jgi:dynein heavy chain 1
VDDFNFKNYSNLFLWVPELEKRISGVLQERLKEVIDEWLNEFKNWEDSKRERITKTQIFEMKIRDQVIYLDPPIEQARFWWMQEFHKEISIICNLNKIQAERYDQFQD